MTQVSDDEVSFLTQGDPQKEDVVLSLWHDRLKLLVVTDGEKGCRYFTKALFLSTYFAPHNFLNDYNSSLYSKVFPFSPHCLIIRFLQCAEFQRKSAWVFSEGS
jgi:hypothetical protein